MSDEQTIRDALDRYYLPRIAAHAALDRLVAERDRYRDSAWPEEVHTRYLVALDERDAALARAEAAEKEAEWSDLTPFYPGGARRRADPTVTHGRGRSGVSPVGSQQLAMRTACQGAPIYPGLTERGGASKPGRCCNTGCHFLAGLECDRVRRTTPRSVSLGVLCVPSRFRAFCATFARTPVGTTLNTGLTERGAGSDSGPPEGVPADRPRSVSPARGAA